MQFGTYEFNCRFTEEAHLPVYKGSTFRGVFGRALKQVVCALKRSECPTCLLKNDCLYPAVFEPRLLNGKQQNNGTPPRPHPFVIQPPPETNTCYPEGTPFSFNLVLFGSFNHRLPYFVYAFHRMGRIGLGKKINGRRGTYCLENIKSQGSVIYRHSDSQLHNAATGQNLTLSRPRDLPSTARAVTLTFTTPLRLKHNNHLARNLPFHLLVRAMLRRTAALHAHFDGAQPLLDYRGLVERARTVTATRSTLAWQEWQRYSLRQKEKMKMGGLTGSITYQGDLTAYLPLLYFCRNVHLGKQTTFGLGRFTMEVIQ